MIKKEYLDKRMCDVEKCSNVQTYREFIKESEKEFCMKSLDLDNISEEKLKNYFDFLDELWCK